MNSEIITKIVTTNAGWLARQIVKYIAVITAIIAAWLHGKGFSEDITTIATATTASVLFGLAEITLSWIARKYKVADDVRMNLDALRPPPTTKLPTIMLLGSCLLLCQCEQFKALVVANEPLIEEALVYGVRAGVKSGVRKLEPAAKQPKNVTP